jgi:cell division protein FtsL
MLELREQHLNLTFQTDKLHNQIEASQAQLWNQQLSIAVATAPDAVAAAAKGQDLKLTAGRAPLPTENK